MTTTTATSVAPGTGASARPVQPPGPRRGLGVGEYTLADGFWGRRQQVNAAASIQHCHAWMERLGWIANFDSVARGTTADRAARGWQFADSEIYKLLEAIAWQLGHAPTPELEDLYDDLVTRVVAAQDDDGYLNTRFGHAGQRPRYGDLEEGHELYCTGHLLQAAVARVRTRGEDALVTAARRAADQVCAEFGPSGRAGLCGHPEIETALAELGRALDEPRYLEQAALFVERRGHGTLRPIPLLSSAYFQDDVPLREAHTWSGHAVRALYLAAGAVDVASERGDTELLDAVARQWDAVVARRTYLTGGMGSRHQDEGFGEDFELPADRAYCETCAGVGAVMVSWRLYLQTGDVKYADLVERVLFNVVAVSPRADGRAFFYSNPLHQRSAGSDVEADAENPRAEGGVRAPWFDVSCCPTNVARTLASWQSYAVAVEPGGVTLLQYAAGEVDVELEQGRLRLQVDTSYPDDSTVTVTVLETPPAAGALRVRVPRWSDTATLGRPGASPHPVEPGIAVALPTMGAGDTVTLTLPLTPRLTWPDPRIDAVRGTVAVEVGPLVHCLESLELPTDLALDDVQVDATAGPRSAVDGHGVEVRLLGPAHGGPSDSAHPMPYLPTPPPPVTDDAERADWVRLTPYHRWAERGPTAMRVFLPVRPTT
ncbi:glycoside hydrolase family 127 protein [Litorihabitans aurantiacus]|uniref:Glycoside hydrolase family 127 protein n=1 Tax=Litorihabitans aurantiacus TaxID=1930061 RepID=A0AA37XHQ6_9MICO|nr:beta-L-arabinofuranosidase domain-containing protein [Litorihabitans aurantiacus]GMA33438.1 hypothetical protein GCM10025875_34300 [Litorihabitans aurantiacus]